jgi:hypothetical protein
MVQRGLKKHIKRFFWEHIPQKSPLAAVLRSTCLPPRRCLLPLATVAPETLPPLTTTPAAACHPAQHNDKGGGGAPSIAASSLLPLVNDDKGGEARQQPLPPTTTRGNEVDACRRRHHHCPLLQFSNVVLLQWYVLEKNIFSFELYIFLLTKTPL